MSARPDHKSRTYEPTAHPRWSYLRSASLINRPYRVMVNGETFDELYDQRDAIMCARIAKRDNATASVVIIDRRSGKPVFRA